ncbi:hypothetical protein PVAND_008523 [Polypedilum vanderplanki]|uniref:Uncharacterized protein n=1 Tax=Polypedilum vanderplanki TaxID=319348 RepID=A0A9J6CAW6_POLVA|nr:hypothetical protein PVAND_008523 [Polypedilum vanderplanki]
MESIGSKTDQDWRQYEEIPSREQLRIDLATFLSKRPEFNGPIKIGKSFLREKKYSNSVLVSSRYSWTDEFEVLKTRNIFAECETEELALQIERALQDIAIDLGILIPGSDKCEGSLSKENHRFIVYVTKQKSIEDRCLGCERYYSRGKKSHMLKHHMGFVRAWRDCRQDIIDAKLEGTKEGRQILENCARMLKWVDMDDDDRTVLLSLQALLAAAEPDDPQDAVVANQYKENYEMFCKTAKHWTNVYAKGPHKIPEFDTKVQTLKNIGEINDAFENLKIKREKQKNFAKQNANLQIQLEDNINRNEQLHGMIENGRLRDRLAANIEMLKKKKAWQEYNECKLKYDEADSDVKKLNRLKKKQTGLL